MKQENRDNLSQTFSLTRVFGKGRGKDMGIPTINFQIPQEIKLPYGIYAGWLYVNNMKYKAAIHFGPRPAFDETDPSLEAYILSGEVPELPDHLQLEFVAFIREVKNFPSPEDMLKRIDQDIEEVKKHLD